jgi:hypothetical protein
MEERIFSYPIVKYAIRSTDEKFENKEGETP